MAKRYFRWTLALSSFAVLFLTLTFFGPGRAKANPQQYPILDKVADKVIQKYQQSTCEQLWEEKSKKTPPSAEEQKVIGFLKSDPQMRTIFINKVAGPIAEQNVPMRNDSLS